MELTIDNPAVVALDVTIGLIVIYLGLSVIASATLEVIANLRRSRTAFLRLALQRILDDHDGSGSAAKGSDVTDNVLSHPLVANLGRPIGPFSQLLFRAKDGPAYLSSERFADALLDVLKKNSGRENIDASIDALPEGGLKVALSAMRSRSAGEEDFVLRLRSWYDELMERAVGWYKRSAQVWLFAIGLALAVGLNVDTLQYSARLSCDGLLRGMLVDEAAKFADSNIAASSGLSIIAASGQNTSPGTAPGTHSGCPSIFAGVSGTGCTGAESVVGNKDTCKQLPESQPPMNLIGWLLTAFAVSLGAPYWLSLLRMLVALRSSLPIAKPEPPEPGAKKDRGEREGPPSGSADDRDVNTGMLVEDRDSVEDVQMILGLRGTQITGKLDAVTSQAIAGWQRQRGMAETGLLTSDLYDLIVQVPTSAKPRLA